MLHYEACFEKSIQQILYHTQWFIETKALQSNPREFIRRYKNLIITVAAVAAIASYVLPLDNLFAIAKTDKHTTSSTTSPKTNHQDSKTVSNTKGSTEKLNHDATKTKPPPPPPPGCQKPPKGHAYGCVKH